MARSENQPLRFVWIGGMDAVEPAEWDALALPLETPLMEWEWLHQLEASGSIAPANGWAPRHLTVRRGDRLIAAAPLYLKSHSQGEFVFDYVWADVSRQLGSRYYPKLVGMSPVTPIVGYRFLIAPEEDERDMTKRMIGEIDRLCQGANLSGVSFHFVDERWAQWLPDLGFIGWLHQGFVWKNKNYENFDDYLGPFTSNQRRNIRRERKSMGKQGLTIRRFTGEDIDPKLVNPMWRFYEATNDQYGPWGCKYLTRNFFESIFQRYRHRLLLIAAFPNGDAGEPVGMSMLLHKGGQVLGRYWGSDVEIPNLHFNACYYEPIDWAIRHGARQFDPGMGGSHKIRRGFEAFGNHSYHRFTDPRLNHIMRLHIDGINQAEQDQIDAVNEAIPFAQRETGSPGH
jgi:predicted N-acyltransferase